MAEQTTHSRYGQLDHDYVASLYAVTEADDAPFFMLNLMRYREWADYGDDRPRITGREADDLYAPLAVLADLGAEVVLFGDVVEQPRGAESWDRVAIVRYPSKRSFVEMQDRPDFLAQHVHKAAGMEQTVIALCHPVAGSVRRSRRVLVDLVSGHDSTDVEDGQLLLSVEGAPIGDGRRWSAVCITGLPDDTEAVGHLAKDATEASSVTVAALINSLP